MVRARRSWAEQVGRWTGAQAGMLVTGVQASLGAGGRATPTEATRTDQKGGGK